MVCPKCKSNLVENASFCHVCGEKLANRKGTPAKYSAVNIYNAIMLIAYGLSLLACFICNLAISHKLSWFYIVFASILLSFSITNLPWILKKHRVLISGVAATLLIYFVLYTCCAYTGGDWLFSFAYPIATYSLVFAWLILAVVKYMKVNWGYKISIILLLSGIFTITCNPFIAYLSGDTYKFRDSFVYDGGSTDYSGNGITFVCLLAAAVISAVVGILKARNANK